MLLCRIDRKKFYAPKKKKKKKKSMIEYLTELFQNICDHSLQAAKGAHLVVMTKMKRVSSLRVT